MALCFSQQVCLRVCAQMTSVPKFQHDRTGGGEIPTHVASQRMAVETQRCLGSGLYN